MAQSIKYVAQIDHVREVSLLGRADLSFWTERLRSENLVPLERDQGAQILVIAAHMKFMGISFSEVSFSVLVTGLGFEGAYMIQAFNSQRAFAWVERNLFGTPYFHAESTVCTEQHANVTLSSKGNSLFEAKMGSVAGTKREPLRLGPDGWEGPVFLPTNGKKTGKAFYARVQGETRTYPFLPEDSLKITTAKQPELFGLLRESSFRGLEWSVRPDGNHGKSKTYRREELQMLALTAKRYASSETGKR